MRMLRGSTRAAQVAVARRTEREISVLCRRLVANMADMSEVVNLYLQKQWLVPPQNGFRMKVCEAFLAEALPARPLRVMWLPADRWLVLHWARQAAQTLEDCMEGPTSSEHMFLRMKLGRQEVRRDARLLRQLLGRRDFDLRMVWEQPDAVRDDVWLQRAEAWSRKRASGAGHHTVQSWDGAACRTEGKIWCFLVARGSSDTMHGARCMPAPVGSSRGSPLLKGPAVMGGSALQVVQRGSCRAASSARVCQCFSAFVGSLCSGDTQRACPSVPHTFHASALRLSGEGHGVGLGVVGADDLDMPRLLTLQRDLVVFHFVAGAAV